MYKSERFKTGYTFRKEEQRAEPQLRYNHYHDPQTGRFASAGTNGGLGLFYSMGRGKGGAVVGDSSQWNPFKTTKTGQLSFF